MGQLAIIRPRPLLSALSCPPGGGSLGSGARKEAPPPCLLMSPAIIHVPWPTWPGQDVRHAGAPARPSATHARAGPDAGAFFGWRRRVLRGGGHAHSLTHSLVLSLTHWSSHSLTHPSYSPALSPHPTVPPQSPWMQPVVADGRREAADTGSAWHLHLVKRRVTRRWTDDA